MKTFTQSFHQNVVES